MPLWGGKRREIQVRILARNKATYSLVCVKQKSKCRRFNQISYMHFAFANAINTASTARKELEINHYKKIERINNKVLGTVVRPIIKENTYLTFEYNTNLFRMMTSTADFGGTKSNHFYKKKKPRSNLKRLWTLFFNMESTPDII